MNALIRYSSRFARARHLVAITLLYLSCHQRRRNSKQILEDCDLREDLVWVVNKLLHK